MALSRKGDQLATQVDPKRWVDIIERGRQIKKKGGKMESEEQIKAIEQLYYWLQGGTSFSCLLYTLFQKADVNNRIKLASAFPEYATALDRWNAAGNQGKDLFAKYGLLETDASKAFGQSSGQSV